MKKVSLVIFLLMFLNLPCCFGSPVEIKLQKNTEGKFIFVYHIPDEVNLDSKSIANNGENEQEDIISDDITADTSIKAENNEDNAISDYGTNEENENIENTFIDENYQVSDLYTDVLKGYASYDEDEITLDDDYRNYINIQKPFRIGSENYSDLKTSNLQFYDHKYSKYYTPEYSIEPVSGRNYKTIGGFSAGTSYSQEIDYGELEQTSGIFSRYEYKRFALETSYTKTVNTTNNNYNDKFAVAPEVKINDYFILKNKYSSDMVLKRNKAELILSVNPFGKRDFDRLRLEFGVSRTFDQNNNALKDQFQVMTNFKL